jgi:hypothetical protein
MPNCDYCGTPEDHRGILDFLFEENTCDVFELSSDHELPLRQFSTATEVLDQFQRTYPNGKPWHSVTLHLYVKDAGPRFKPLRVDLNPEACDGATFRHASEGWGLVQLYLSTTDGTTLRDSHTNHNTLKRATKWASSGDSLGPPSAWDFAKITAFSSRLNRHIRKAKVAKLKSRVVLAGALKAWDQGCVLSPYDPTKHDIERLT